MNEPKPEDVMRALECCIKTQCENCCNLGSWHEQWNCMTDLMKKALALIREKDARIEALTMQSEDLEAELSQAYELYKENDAEIERLKGDFEKAQCSVELLGAELGKLGLALSQVEQIARAEAITEFSKELTSELIKGGIYPVFVKGAIERTSKKLKGETDGESDL